MSPFSISFILLLHIATALPSLLATATSPTKGFHLSCGATKPTTVGGIEWTPDDGFIGVGRSSKIDSPGIAPILSSVRYFPDKTARKYCYTFPVAKGSRVLIRTMYFYGGFDGGKEPPVFDQIVGGAKWSTVNTTGNYAKGLSSYFEIILAPPAKTISVCLARNKQTNSAPFISAIELEYLDNLMYDHANFTTSFLAAIARHQFGHDGQLISYPDDPFNRYWEPFKDNNPIVESKSNITSSDFWNLPPARALRHGLTTSRGKELVVQWPAMALPGGSYYMALYFQDNRTPSPYSWRVFDVSVNGQAFYKGLNVSTGGVMVYGVSRPLSGQTTITLNPDASSKVGPVINAGELFLIVPLGGRTLTRDVIAMEEMARGLKNRPADWSGDPCFPSENSWTGVTCSTGKHTRVIALNLTNSGLSGSLPKNINNLTALSSIWLGGNKLSGPIPEMGSLKSLTFLHLEDNELTGSVPASLGHLPNLKEIFIQNNKLDNRLPESLTKRKEINIKMSS